MKQRIAQKMMKRSEIKGEVVSVICVICSYVVCFTSVNVSPRHRVSTCSQCSDRHLDLFLKVFGLCTSSRQREDLEEIRARGSQRTSLTRTLKRVNVLKIQLLGAAWFQVVRGETNPKALQHQFCSSLKIKHNWFYFHMKERRAAYFCFFQSNLH